MTNQLCGSCKHWGDDSERKSGTDFRSCRAVIHDKRGLTSEWRDEMLGDDWYDKDDEDIPEIRAFRATHKAVAVDGSGYAAALRTRTDFGCVLHER